MTGRNCYMRKFQILAAAGISLILAACGVQMPPAPSAAQTQTPAAGNTEGTATGMTDNTAAAAAASSRQASTEKTGGGNMEAAASTTADTTEPDVIADTDWKKLYLDFLNNMRDPDGNPYDPSIFSTGFIYVNNDSVPEMVISTMSEAGGNLIAGIFHGEVKTYQTARLGLRYVEKRNIIDNADGHMGGYYDELLRMGEDDFEPLPSGTYGFQDPSGTKDIAGNTQMDYEWDGKSVSQEQYRENLEKAFNTRRAVSWESGMTMDDMKNYLQGSTAGKSYKDVYADIVRTGIIKDAYGANDYTGFALQQAGSGNPALIAVNDNAFSIVRYDDGMLFQGPAWYFSQDANETILLYPKTGYVQNSTKRTDGSSENWYRMRNGSLETVMSCWTEALTDSDGNPINGTDGLPLTGFYVGNGFWNDEEAYRGAQRRMQQQVQGDSPLRIGKDLLSGKDGVQSYLSGAQMLEKLSD